MFTQQLVAAKVPQITVLVWVIKISTTAAGEAISDWLAAPVSLWASLSM